MGKRRYTSEIRESAVGLVLSEGLSPGQARAYRIADNQLNTLAEFDYELLPIELPELKELGCDLDLSP